MSTWASLFDEPGIPSELAPRVWGNPVILRTICQFSSTEALLRMGRVDSDGLTEATKQTWGMKRKVDKIEKTLNKVGENNPRHELYRNAIRHIHVGRNPKTTFQQYMLRFPNLRSLVVEHKGKDKSYSFASLSYAWTKTLEGKYTATCQFDSLEGTNTAAHLAFARDYLPTGWEATYTIEDAFILDIEKIGKVRKMSLEVQHFTVWPELFTPGLPDALADMLQENQPRTVSVRCLHFGADGSMVMDEDCLATKIHTVDEAADVLARISNSAMLNRRGLLAGRANTFTNVAMLLLQATRHIRAFPIFDCSFELPDITDISAAAQLIIPASTYRVPYRSYAHRITFRLSDPQRGHVPPADYLVRLHQNRAWIRILARICMIVWGPGARYNVEIGSMSIESGTWFRKEEADDLRALRQILVDTSAAYNSMLNDAITMLDEMQPKEAPVIGWKRLTKD